MLDVEDWENVTHAARPHPYVLFFGSSSKMPIQSLSVVPIDEMAAIALLRSAIKALITKADFLKRFKMAEINELPLWHRGKCVRGLSLPSFTFLGPKHLVGSICWLHEPQAQLGSQPYGLLTR